MIEVPIRALPPKPPGYETKYGGPCDYLPLRGATQGEHGFYKNVLGPCRFSFCLYGTSVLMCDDQGKPKPAWYINLIHNGVDLEVACQPPMHQDYACREDRAWLYLLMPFSCCCSSLVDLQPQYLCIVGQTDSKTS